MAAQKQQIDLRALMEIGRTGALRAAAFVALGQKAWTDEALKSVTMDTPFSIRLLPEPLPEQLAKEVRSEFRIWVMGNALAEIVQACLGLRIGYTKPPFLFNSMASRYRRMHTIAFGNATLTLTYIPNSSASSNWD